VNLQVAIGADARLTVAVDRPVPDDHYDCTAYRDLGSRTSMSAARM
jgi:hypothetical protein